MVGTDRKRIEGIPCWIAINPPTLVVTHQPWEIELFQSGLAFTHEQLRERDREIARKAYSQGYADKENEGLCEEFSSVDDYLATLEDEKEK